MPKSKYHYFNIGLTAKFMMEIRKETHQLGISKQEFIRSLVKEYFIRVHGRDLVFEQQAPKGGVNFNPTKENNENY